MLLIICSNGDNDSEIYKQAEAAFAQKLYKQKASSIPKDTRIRIFSNSSAKLPDVSDQMAAQSFLTVLLSRLKIDPLEAKLSWQAEMYEEFGYTFVVFFLTADNPSYSLEDAA